MDLILRYDHFNQMKLSSLVSNYLHLVLITITLSGMVALFAG